MRTDVRRLAVLMGVLACGATVAFAQESTGPAEVEMASSTERGRTTLDDSFDWAARRARIQEQRGAALSNTQFNAEFRTMFLDRDKYDDSESSSWAGGGSAGLKTGYFRDFLALGATAYTSQHLDGSDDKDGALLLKPGQQGYSVIGELYGDLRIVEDLHLNVGRKGHDTPYINRNDVRMTPNTFEAVTLQGVCRPGDGPSAWNYGAGYFDKIKERNSDDFVSMSEDAGADVERGVYTGGLLFKRNDFSIGAINYYSDDIINIAYTEAKHVVPLADLKLRLAVQYTDQQSVGDDKLNGDDFSADQFGIKADVPVLNALFTVAFTQTGDGSNMQNPWSGYPGYTSVQVEDFNRAGEGAVLLRAAYTFTQLKGLSAYALWVSGTEPDDDTQFERDEYDFNVQWKAGEGPLNGLMLRARYAVVTQDEDADASDLDDLEDLRLMCFYDLAAWL